MRVCNFFVVPPKLNFVSTYSIGLKYSQSKFRRSEEVSALHFDHKGAYCVIFLGLSGERVIIYVVMPLLYAISKKSTQGSFQKHAFIFIIHSYSDLQGGVQTISSLVRVKINFRKIGMVYFLKKGKFQGKCLLFKEGSSKGSVFELDITMILILPDIKGESIKTSPS